MIGIVVVSHSASLARAAVELALEMGGDAPPAVEIAAGTADGGFGTDAAAIAAAIERLSDSDGVLVVMDLGSALLSAEMALEFVSTDTPVVLSAAPFVEGLLAAVVLATAGADLDTVAAEAQGALGVKREQLVGTAPEAAGGAEAVGDAAGGAEAVGDAAGGAEAVAPAASEAYFDAVIRNPSGLHARPAALFVKAASRHEAAVELTDLDHGEGPVSARSLIALMALGVRPGTRVRISARGTEAQAAIAELRALVDEGFGEL